MNAIQMNRPNQLASVISVAFALLVSPLASASDGVIEINQARMAEGGITSGDTPGFPITISQPGSYRLTSNLSRFLSFIPIGSVQSHMIDVVADDVTIDLNGFRISCVRSVLIVGGGGSSGPCPSQSDGGLGDAEGDGIHGTGSNLAVLNGTIWGMPDDGIDAGIDAGDVLIKNVRLVRNGDSGAIAHSGSLVMDSTAKGNGGAGFYITGGGQLARATTTENRDGVRAQSGATIRDSMVYNNTRYGIWGSSYAYTGNHVYFNLSGNTSGSGTSMPPNSNWCQVAYCP